MRILIDTNILFSALLFPRSKPAKALLYIAQNHEMVLCDRNIAELRDILNRKAPKYLPDAEVLLAEMSYELIPAVDHAEKLIRDAKDQRLKMRQHDKSCTGGHGNGTHHRQRHDLTGFRLALFKD